VFGGVESGSGNTFLVAERTVLLLMYYSNLGRRNYNRGHHIRVGGFLVVWEGEVLIILCRRKKCTNKNLRK
jgi:hypothetical protein